ncbi:hypothetical protein SEVIR_5G268933v4 [Setaria viridis]
MARPCSSAILSPQINANFAHLPPLILNQCTIIPVAPPRLGIESLRKHSTQHGLALAPRGPSGSVPRAACGYALVKPRQAGNEMIGLELISTTKEVGKAW